MKKILSILCILSFFSVNIVKAQEYLSIVTLESATGVRGTFLSAGIGNGKDGCKDNAIKSLFYTLFFQGVEGVNDGKPLVAQANKSYTDSFFDFNKRYVHYVVETEEYVKPKKADGVHQGTFRIIIRLTQLINDVRKNTGYQKVQETVKKTQPKPTVIVVPFKKDGESYKSILENDYDRRVAVEEVKKGFNNCDIRTMDLLTHIQSAERRGQYEENAGAVESNDRTLLASSNADVYVVVDLKKEQTAQGNRVSLILHAHDVATNADWGSQTGGSKQYYRTAPMDALCRYAVEDNIQPFLEQIMKYYSEPTRVSLQVTLLNDPDNNTLMSLQDPECANGDSVADFIMYWLDDNAHDGDYHLQGVVDEQVIFDYIMIPKTDKRGRKMNSLKFLSQLKKDLRDEGIHADSRLEGGTIIITVSKGF